MYGGIGAGVSTQWKPSVDGGGPGSLASDPVTTSQHEISDEIAKIQADTPTGAPLLDFPPYRSTRLRHPTKEFQQVDPEGAELLAPVFGHSDVGVVDTAWLVYGRTQRAKGRVIGLKDPTLFAR